MRLAISGADQVALLPGGSRIARLRVARHRTSVPPADPFQPQNTAAAEPTHVVPLHQVFKPQNIAAAEPINGIRSTKP